MPRETYNARYLSASPSYLTVPRRGSSHLRHTPRGEVEAGVLRRSIESISTVSRRISTGIPARSAVRDAFLDWNREKDR